MRKRSHLRKQNSRPQKPNNNLVFSYTPGIGSKPRGFLYIAFQVGMKLIC